MVRGCYFLFSHQNPQIGNSLFLGARVNNLTSPSELAAPLLGSKDKISVKAPTCNSSKFDFILILVKNQEKIKNN